MNSQFDSFGQSVSYFTRRRFYEGCGLVWLSIAVFLSLSLISYHSLDPSLNVAASAQVHNWMGAGGAFVADLLLQSVGLGSFFLVLALLGWSWRQVIVHQPLHLLWQSLPLITSLLAISYVLALFPPPSTWPVQAGFGGAFGSLLLAQIPSHTLQWIGGGVMLLLFIILFGAGCALTRREWKGIGMFMAYITFRTANGIRSIFSNRPQVSFSFYDAFQQKHNRLSLTGWIKRENVASGSLDGVLNRVGSRESVEIRDDEPQLNIDTPKKRVQRKSKKGEQTSLQLARREGGFELPSVTLLKETPKTPRGSQLSEKALEQNARMLESVLHDFGVKGEIIGISPGPVVTLYELEPAAGTKSSRVIGLADDIARSMSAISARISVIPGRNAMGIELPNTKRETVYFRELLESKEFTQTDSKLPMVLGKDIGGEPIIADLSKMPHLLVAGTTGSGKSVSVNTMIASLLYFHTPDECKFIMIDPKMLELSVYDGIPHLLAPVVTEPPKAVVALKWVTKEMENRYRMMASLGVRNMEGYNKRIKAARAKGEELKRTVQTGFDPETGKPIYEDQPLDMNPLPFIVVVVDEMADLMLVAGKDIEGNIQRLAQMARAAGIHIIMATQRPSVDVITGVIKANFPTRISFQVTSRIDSRTILGEQGAEQLLGMGDMLYMAGGGRTTRVHGPFISDSEIGDIVDFLKSQGEPDYVEDVTIDPEESGDMFTGEELDEETMLYQKGVTIVKRDGKASTSYLQRCLRIGYNRAARMIDQMEEEGIITAPNHAGKREVL